MRGIRHGATAGAAVAFAVAWFLPWMADTAAFPLLGHAFNMWYWFSFEAPGPGAGLEIVLFGLVGLFAFASVGFAAHRTAAVAAALGAVLGVSLMMRDHPGLDSGPGPLVAAVALAVLSVAQTIASFRTDVGRSWWSAVAGVLVAALLALATGFGGVAYASARDIDATTSDGSSAVTVANQDGVLSGITARDSTTGTERWHYRARDWRFPSVGLSGDGHTAFVTVQRVDEEDAYAFDALSGKLRWQRALGAEGWPGPTPGRSYGYFQNGPGLLVSLGADRIRYLDADGHEGVLQLDKNCGIDGTGGVHTLYIVEQCQGWVQLLAADRNAQHLWTAPAYHVPIGKDAVVVDKGDTVVVTADGQSETFEAVSGNPVKWTAPECPGVATDRPGC